MSQSIANQTACLLIVAHENGSRTEHAIEPGCSLFIGSSESCGIHIAGTDIADKHCLVNLHDGVLSIQDWVSPTGTLVNGVAIDSQVRVTETDTIRLGNASITLRSSAVPNRSLLADQTPAAPVEVDEPEVDGEATAAPTSTTTSVELEQSLDDLDVCASELLTGPDPADDAVQDASWGSDTSQFDEQAAWNNSSDNDEDADPAGSSNFAWDDPLDDFGAEPAEQYDQQTVDLLKAEIDDLRSALMDRDAQIREFTQEFAGTPAARDNSSADAGDQQLQRRIDELLAEAAEQDERAAIMQDLIHAREVKSQAEAEERKSLEDWVGGIEHRVAQRESEWNAELDSLKDRLAATVQERDQLQHQLRQVASRFDATNAYQETLDQLQSRNAKLQEKFEIAHKKSVKLKQQLENLKNREADVLQEERATIAKERAAVSRMRFELSRKLSEFEAVGEPRNVADKEAALRLQTLRSHLREIHEQEQQERAQKGESLLTRISSLWKRMDDEY